MLTPCAASRVLGPLACGKATGGVSSLLTGLVSYWPMDEAAGNRVDVVAGHDWVPVGAPGAVAGIIGNAAECLSASSQQLTLNWNYVPAEGDITIAQWQGRGSAVQTPIVFLSATAFNGGTYAIYTYEGNVAGGQAICVVYDSSGGSKSASILGIGTSDAWRLLVFGYESVTKRAFMSVAGSAKVYSGVLANGIRTGCLFNHIGRSAATGYRNTRPDEMGIWSRVLTDPEIATLYNGGVGKTHPFA